MQRKEKKSTLLHFFRIHYSFKFENSSTLRNKNLFLSSSTKDGGVLEKKPPHFHPSLVYQGRVKASTPITAKCSHQKFYPFFAWPSHTQTSLSLSLSLTTTFTGCSHSIFLHLTTLDGCESIIMLGTLRADGTFLQRRASE